MSTKKETATAEAVVPKKVKIKTLRAISIGEGKEATIVNPGFEVMVTEEEAKMFCDTKFPGYHPFYGHMPEIGPLMDGIANPLERREIVRAVRIA